MNSSTPSGGDTVQGKNDVKELAPALVVDDSRRIKLRPLGFVGHVSQDAKTAIQRNAARANRVLATATRFAFR